MPSQCTQSALAAAASRGDVTTLARAAARGVAAAAPAAKPLEAENASLRRELAEVRQQLMEVTAAAAPPGANAQTLPAAFWLEAQLRQSRRHVQLLSEALVKRAELSTEVEAILLQIREQQKPTARAPDDSKGGAPARGLTPEWAAAAMRRVRSVQFAEELAVATAPYQFALATRAGTDAAAFLLRAALRVALALRAPSHLACSPCPFGAQARTDQLHSTKD